MLTGQGAPAASQPADGTTPPDSAYYGKQAGNLINFFFATMAAIEAEGSRYIYCAIAPGTFLLSCHNQRNTLLQRVGNRVILGEQVYGGMMPLVLRAEWV